VRVVVAPDKFSGTLTAAEAASAIRSGWLRAAPGDTVDLVPLSDGGAGFVDVLAAALTGTTTRVATTGPWGDPVVAEILRVDGGTAYVESAQCCGAAGEPLRPWEASTAGLATVIDAAVAAGAHRVVVGVGGTSTTDGGRGCVSALGAVPPQVQLVAATDVASPLLGPAGAARGFAPQKGADDAMVERMEERLRVWAADSAGDPDAPGAGAGGGLGFGLSLLGAARVSGAALVADIVGLSDRIAEADVVVTGEGTIDWSSLRGKVVAEVARRAVEHGRPCIVLAGQSSVGSREAAAAGIDEVHSAAGGAGSAAASLADPVEHLSRLAERVAGQWSRGPAAGGVRP
jgi:glycerate kinase